MDGNLIHSLMGTQASPESKAKKADAGDADMFSKALDDATGGKSNAGKAGSSMIDEKSDKAQEKKEEKKKQAKAEQEEWAKVAGAKVDKGTPAYLRKLMQTNPDALSMAEKQAARVGEFAAENQARSAQQQKLAPQPFTPNPLHNSTQKQVGGAAQAGGKGSAKVDKDEAQDKATQKPVDAKEAAAFESLTKEQSGEKGKVNLEKLLGQEVKASEEAQKTSQAAEKAKERQGVIDQILAQIQVHNVANKTELHLRLNPEYLGELKLNLVKDENGVKADFVTTSRATRDALVEGEDELREQAKNKGVRLNAVKVKLVDDLA